MSKLEIICASNEGEWTHQGVYERKKNGAYSVSIVTAGDKPSVNLTCEDFFEWFPHVSRKTSLGCGEVSWDFIDYYWPPEVDGEETELIANAI
jgi:hypothetical protein